MALRQTRLYYKTGLTVGNVPESPALLETASHIDLNAHWDYQDYFLGKLDVEATYEQVKNADYLKYGNAYYFVVSIGMINENTARLTLQIDALTTLGGPLALNYEGGVVKQAHVQSSKDSYFYNTIQPNIGLSQILVAKGKTGNVKVGGKCIIASTLDLSVYPAKEMDDNNLKAYRFKTDVGISGDPEAEVVIPEGLPIAKSTALKKGEKSVMTTAGFGYYDASNAVVKKNLQFARDLGTEGCILYSYMVPGEILKNGLEIDEHGYVKSMKLTNSFDGSSYMFDEIDITEDYSKNYKNKKTYTTYSTYTLQSILSGDSHTYDPADIVSPFNNRKINFVKLADPQYGGRIYVYPQNYKGSSTDYNIGMGVKGLPWKDYPIAFSSPSGSQFITNSYAQQKGDISRNKFSDVAGAEQSIMTNIMGIGATLANSNPSEIATVGQLMGGTLLNPTGASAFAFRQSAAFLDGPIINNPAGNLDTVSYKLAKARADYAEAQVIAPDLTCSPCFGLQNIITSQFMVWHLYPSKTDLDRIDKYYTEYGYPMGNCVFDKSMLTGHANFNYIEVSDITIKSSSYNDAGIAILTQAENQMTGVRIWHKLPTR